MKYLLQLSLVLFSLSRLSAMTPEEADAKLKASINENRVIVDICIYEQQWISPNNEFPKGRLIKRAVVTEVYKGTDVALGAKLEFDEIADEFPGEFRDFTSPKWGQASRIHICLACERDFGQAAAWRDQSVFSIPGRSTT